MRARADGALEFLGRRDGQVKIRGHRVELGELEAVLGEHGGLAQSAVVVRESAGGDATLVAYVVPAHPDAAPARAAFGGAVRAWLQTRVPDALLPAAVVVLDALPHTATGKVDRAALPAPTPTTSAAAGEAADVFTALEEIVAGVWREVLGVDAPSAGANFFDLGGHSLVATQVVARLRTVLGIEVPLRALFEAPTVRALAALIEETRAQGGRPPASPPLTSARPASATAPLSFAQQRLWFIDQLEPGQTTYNIAHAVRLTGALDIDALRRGVTEIIRRHEVLRTTFPAVNGVPVQRVASAAPVLAPVIDLSVLATSAAEAMARRWAAVEARQPFDLAEGPLVRLRLLRLGPAEHVLLATMHHIVSDGWSVGILVREFAALYAGFAAGEPSSLAPLPVQYADFAIWQREWLQGPVLDTHLAYWRTQLAETRPLALPTDAPRPATPTYAAALAPFHLDAALTAEVRALCRREGVTLFMTLLAAFTAVLSRLANQDDVTVGTPIANRTHAETEGLIGFFVNQLVLRAHVTKHLTFRQFFQQIRETVLDAFEHQDVPFEKLVEELAPDRHLDRSPFFQVALLLQNQPQHDFHLPALTLEPFGSAWEPLKCDLSLAVRETPDGLDGGLQFAVDLFAPATVERLTRQLRSALESMTADLDRGVRDWPLLTPAESEQVLVTWNATRTEIAEPLLVHALIEQRVARAADSIALVCGDVHLSYRALEERAHRLARTLRVRGAGPETCVAIYLPRGIDFIVAMFAVLESGAAYVPLDGHQPAARLARMLRDTRARIAITHRDAALPADVTAPVYIDGDWEQESSRGDTRRRSGVLSEHLACAIFTSGSTGEPKAVAITHRSLVNATVSLSRAFDLCATDRALQLVSGNFDAFGAEVFPLLAEGGTLVLRADPDVIAPEECLRLIRQEAITLFYMPPAVWNQLVDYLDAHDERVPSSLRLFAGGGEAQSSGKVRSWAARGGDRCRFINAYGPTEATITATRHEVDFTSTAHRISTHIPIGSPVANAQCYVVDDEGQPVPPGVQGELLIGGMGVARGYVNRPELTAEVFVPDPFGEEPGARLYRTGDRVCWQPDGHLRFLGRTDDQVKIRGIRVEPGEIEAVLARHPGVGQAVVAVREDPAGQPALVAYVVGEPGATIEIGALRSDVQLHLPAYMSPAAFVLLTALPLTPSGKVERAALPAPDWAARAGEYLAPGAPTEEIVAGVWSALLQVERVGRDDNFFELGGHSLLATQVMSRLREAFAADLPLRALFEHPTVAGFARQVDRTLGAATRSSAPPLVPVDRDGDLPLSFAQQRLWFVDQLEPGNAAYNIPAAVRLTGDLTSARWCER